MLEKLGVGIIGIDDRLAEIAIAAFLHFGKGRHPAKLNFGDCFSYALARLLNVPLLFKGEDFSQTDIRSAFGHDHRLGQNRCSLDGAELAKRNPGSSGRKDDHGRAFTS